jgi:hypothetical protein
MQGKWPELAAAVEWLERLRLLLGKFCIAAAYRYRQRCAATSGHPASTRGSHNRGVGG